MWIQLVVVVVALVVAADDLTQARFAVENAINTSKGKIARCRGDAGKKYKGAAILYQEAAAKSNNASVGRGEKISR